jgi:hypothetical protein
MARQEVDCKVVLKVMDMGSLAIGMYDGLWSGGTVSWTDGSQQYRAETPVVLRGLDVPCLVTVHPHGVSVTTDVKTEQYQIRKNAMSPDQFLGRDGTWTSREKAAKFRTVESLELFAKQHGVDDYGIF